MISEEIEALRATALMWGHISDQASGRIAVFARRRPWSTEPTLAILCEAFGADRSVGARGQRQAVGSVQLYTWRQRALASDLKRSKPIPALFAETDMSVPTTAMVGNGPIWIELQSG